MGSEHQPAPERVRVRVVGGPWKARRGCYGWVLLPPPGPPAYPWVLLAPSEAVVLLEDDPLDPAGRDQARGWSCILAERYLNRVATRRSRSTRNSGAT